MPEFQRQNPAGEAKMLAFENCRLPMNDEGNAGLFIDLEIGQGEFLAIFASDAALQETFLDGALGLVTPSDGEVRFLERRWTDMNIEFAAACRGQIGSSLSENDWLPYWSVLDNLLLPHLYHSRRRYDELRAEASAWARRFGLPGAPDDLPGNIAADDRRRAALVRAFLGDPLLIVLEHQDGALPYGLRTEVLNALGEARQRGASILWLTHDPALSRDPSIPVTQRLRLGAHGLETLEAAA